MNCRYFASIADRTYIDAGYRWAYWLLEHPGIVKLDHLVNVEVVSSAVDYWNPPEGERSPWLVEKILPRVRTFLDDHRTTEILYVDEDRIFTDQENGIGWIKPAD